MVRNIVIFSTNILCNETNLAGMIKNYGCLIKGYKCIKVGLDYNIYALVISIYNLQFTNSKPPFDNISTVKHNRRICYVCLPTKHPTANIANVL